MKKLILLIIFSLLLSFSFTEKARAQDYAPCGDDLKCDDTTVQKSCPSGRLKCLSEKYFDGADTILNIN